MKFSGAAAVRAPLPAPQLTRKIDMNSGDTGQALRLGQQLPQPGSTGLDPAPASVAVHQTPGCFK